MRKQFNLQDWLKDKSQKVETAFGEPVKIVFTEGLGERPILAVIYDGDTTDTAWFTKDGKSSDGIDGLFIVTQEPMRCENCKDTLCPFRLTAGECRNYPNCMEPFQHFNSTDFDGIKLASDSNPHPAH